MTDRPGTDPGTRQAMGPGTEPGNPYSQDCKVCVALWCSGSMLASHARGPGFNPRVG